MQKKYKYLFLSIFFNYLLFFFKDSFKYFLNIKKLSVIIPIYNTEKYLIECLNSVINQSLKNIEIICIDDGSTDNSSKILKEYSKIDKRFVLINQNNKGSGNARNKGINISRGKFVSFLDSDDMYFNNFALESLYKNDQKNNALICGGGMEQITFVGNNQTYSKKILFLKKGFMNYKDYQFDFHYQRFIYNKNFIKINKLFFPIYRRYQDPPFFIKIMFKAKKFYTITNETNIYMLKPKHNFNIRLVIDMFYGLKECLEFAEKKKLYKLYETSINRLNSKLFLNAAKQHSEDKNLKFIINKIIKSINKNIIKENKLKFVIDDFYKRKYFYH